LHDARYHLAMVLWWIGIPEPDVKAQLAKIDRAQMTDVQRAFMDGLPLFLSGEYHEATGHFRRAAAEHPESRDILYGLFEALFHAGHGAESMVIYRRLVEREPRFQLGLVHALTFYCSRADADGMRWAIGRLLIENVADGKLWTATMHLAERRYDAALRELEGSEVASQPVARELRTGALALDGHIEAALEAAPSVELRTALHLARGDASAAARGLEELERGIEAASPPVGARPQMMDFIILLTTNGSEADRARAKKMLESHPVLGLDHLPALNLLQALVATGNGADAQLEALTKGNYPEAVAGAQARIAERSGLATDAQRHWRSAIDFSVGGRFRIVEHLGLARARREMGDPAGVLTACDEVLRPHMLYAAWGPAVGTCLHWSAEAALAVGHPDEAVTLATRLLALRTRAPANDEHLRAARAVLARAGKR
ncbi:MAG: tetratricopeptide repeat protein, partial [Myxococcales bacterium]|nr:tetratricopeptide repeat protein [Myxococcales bacterium]